MMNKVTLRELALRKVSEHVCNEFNLGDDFVITNFKASSQSITLHNENYEVTVKVTGEASFKLQNDILKAIEEIKEELKEEAQDEE